MRVVAAATLTAAALLLSSLASAQGIGEVAAKEREKRKANPAPVKVVTESDIARTPAKESWGNSSSGSSGGSYTGTGVAGGAPSTPTTGEPARAAGVEPNKPPTIEEQMKQEEEERQKASEDWRKQLDGAQKEIDRCNENIERLRAHLNALAYSFNAPTVERGQKDLQEAEAALVEAKAKYEELQEQGRRAGY